jgi:hypothetical protein
LDTENQLQDTVITREGIKQNKLGTPKRHVDIDAHITKGIERES